MSIAVLDKTFSVLEVMARSGRALSLAEIAEECRMPKPTVYRILRSLHDLGYILQPDRGAEIARLQQVQEDLGPLRRLGRPLAQVALRQQLGSAAEVEQARALQTARAGIEWAAFQVLTGNIIDHAGRVGELYSLSGFKSAFSVCLAGALVCLVLSFLIKAKPTSGD